MNNKSIPCKVIFLLSRYKWHEDTGWWGHINTFNTDWFKTRTQLNLLEYYSYLKQFPDSVSQFNHPYIATFDDFGYYDTTIDELILIMEVKDEEQYNQYKRALDFAWHLAPSYSRDEHNTTWGDTPNDTVILAPRLTEDNIYDELRNRRTYVNIGDRGTSIMTL